MYTNYKGSVKIWPSFLSHNDRNIFYKIIYQKLCSILNCIIVKQNKLTYPDLTKPNLT